MKEITLEDYFGLVPKTEKKIWSYTERDVPKDRKIYEGITLETEELIPYKNGIKLDKSVIKLHQNNLVTDSIPDKNDLLNLVGSYNELVEYLFIGNEYSNKLITISPMVAEWGEIKNNTLDEAEFVILAFIYFTVEDLK